MAEVVRRGIELGTFGGTYDPDKVAVLTIGAVDGMSIPLSVADPEITPASAAQDVMAALRERLRRAAEPEAQRPALSARSGGA